MAKAGFIDFDLLIEGVSKRNYRARVLSSLDEQAVVDFKLPFSKLELENFMLRIGARRRGTRGQESSEIDAIKSFGGKLFKAVFQGEILDSLEDSLEEANKRALGLRLRLRLTNAPDLINLPWEFLYYSDLNRFLSLSTNTPIVRYLELPERIVPLPTTPPLRILVILSNPDDYPKLDVEREWKNLKAALGKLEQKGLLVMELLETVTPMALQYKLRRNDYHIIHFVGHGGFDEQSNDGMLLFEDEKGHGKPFSGQDLGTLLHDERTIRLVILNACEGARTGFSDPFAGVAQSLVQQGIPAIIAMQFEITDQAAITFASEFYNAITEGLPVDAAISDARKGIYFQGNEIEWGTPVLYMRTENGYVFDVNKNNPAATAVAPVHKPSVSNQSALLQTQVAVKTPLARVEALPTVQMKSIPKTTSREIPAKEIPAKKKRTWTSVGIMVTLLALFSLAGWFLFFRPTQLASYEGMVKVTTTLYNYKGGNPALKNDFWIDRYEVTNAQYERYLQQHRGAPPAYWKGGLIPAGQNDFPVQQITWAQAYQYCAEQGKRLPTQAEWELAARGPFGWQFPWGNEATIVDHEVDATLSVGSNASNRSYFGAYDMSGNVSEWVSDLYKRGDPPDHILLGGSFGALDSLTTLSHGTDQDFAVQNAGIRCAADQNDELEKNLHDETLALDDSFASPDTDWPKIGTKGDKFIFNYHDPDYYHLEDRLPNTYIPAFYEPVSFHNFVLETEAFVDAKNTDNQQGNFLYGLAVRQSDGQFFALVVSAKTHEWQALQGNLPIGEKIGATSDLKIVKSGHQEAIIGASDDKADRLVVIANGTELIYYVNGNLVFRQMVDDYGKRNIGFLAVTLADITRIHIHFNWVTLQKIDPFDDSQAGQASQATHHSAARQIIPAAPASPTPSASTPLPAIQKRPADSDSPAAGICDSAQENLVLINIVPGNMPDPRCIKVAAGQRLQIKNGTEAAVRIQLGQLDMTLQAGEIKVFDTPCGDFLEPGVHWAVLSAGSVPEIWLSGN